MKEIQGTPVVIEPEEGLILRDKATGSIYSRRVYLGINDSAQNWEEVPQELTEEQA